MTTLTDTTNARSAQFLMTSLREELALYQEESRFFQKILRKALLAREDGKTERIRDLYARLTAFQQETLPGLQRALRGMDGANANTSTADSGLNQVGLFRQGMEEARRLLNLIKRDAFRELNADFIRSPIW